jgi:phage gpG-like protein
VNYFITIMGERQAITRFNRMGFAAISARPAMEKVAAEMMSIFDRIFSSEGRRGGGSWRQDSPEWLARKIQNGMDPRIMHASLALRNAFTTPESSHQILRITRQSVTLGTDLPYAAAADAERPIRKFTAQDRFMLRMIVRNHLLSAWRRRARLA